MSYRLALLIGQVFSWQWDKIAGECMYIRVLFYSYLTITELKGNRFLITINIKSFSVITFNSYDACKEHISKAKDKESSQWKLNKITVFKAKEKSRGRKGWKGDILIPGLLCLYFFGGGSGSPDSIVVLASMTKVVCLFSQTLKWCRGTVFLACKGARFQILTIPRHLFLINFATKLNTWGSESFFLYFKQHSFLMTCKRCDYTEI